MAQAYGRHTIASAEVPAVNQIRASDDYATGDKLGDHDPNNANLYVGMSSMFAAALGLAPSKDVSVVLMLLTQHDGCGLLPVDCLRENHLSLRFLFLDSWLVPVA